MTRIFPDDIVATDAIQSRIEDLELDYTSTVDGELADVGTWREDHRTEYQALAKIIKAVCGDNVRDNVTLIHENHFEQYIRDYYSDTYAGQYHEQTREDMVELAWGDLMSRAPFNNIDWKAVAADEWPHYSQIEINGVTYLYVEA